MTELDPVVEIKSDHVMVRDALLDLIDVVEKKDATTKLTGPHFKKKNNRSTGKNMTYDGR